MVVFVVQEVFSCGVGQSLMGGNAEGGRPCSNQFYVHGSPGGLRQHVREQHLIHSEVISISTVTERKIARIVPTSYSYPSPQCHENHHQHLARQDSADAMISIIHLYPRIEPCPSPSNRVTDFSPTPSAPSRTH